MSLPTQIQQSSPLSCYDNNDDDDNDDDDEEEDESENGNGNEKYNYKREDVAINRIPSEVVKGRVNFMWYVCMCSNRFDDKDDGREKNISLTDQIVVLSTCINTTWTLRQKGNREDREKRGKDGLPIWLTD